MKLLESIKNVGDQHLVEQNLISSGLTSMLQSAGDWWSKKMEERLEQRLEQKMWPIGPKALSLLGLGGDPHFVRLAMHTESSIRLYENGWGARDEVKTKICQSRKTDSVLKYASKAICDDFDIAMEAVGRFGSIEYKNISYNLQQDSTIISLVLSGTSSHEEAASFFTGLDGKHQAKADIARALIGAHPECLGILSDKFKDTGEFAIHAARSENIVTMQHISPRLKRDVDFARSYFGISAYGFDTFSEEVRGDKRCVANALRSLGRFEPGYVLSKTSSEIRSLLLHADGTFSRTVDESVAILHRATEIEKFTENLKASLTPKVRPSKKMKI